MKPPKRIFKSYEEAAEAQREKDVEEYYNDDEEEIEDEMDEFDQYYDEMQDEKASEACKGE